MSKHTLIKHRNKDNTTILETRMRCIQHLENLHTKPFIIALFLSKEQPQENTMILTFFSKYFFQARCAINYHEMAMISSFQKPKKYYTMQNICLLLRPFETCETTNTTRTLRGPPNTILDTIRGDQHFSQRSKLRVLCTVHT